MCIITCSAAGPFVGAKWAKPGAEAKRLSPAGGTGPLSFSKAPLADDVGSTALRDVQRARLRPGSLLRLVAKTWAKSRWQLVERQSRGGAGSDCEPDSNGRFR